MDVDTLKPASESTIAAAGTDVEEPAQQALVVRQRTDDLLAQGHKHVLETAHLPGTIISHELKPYDLSLLSEEDIVALHSHRAFEHLARQEMLNLIARYGPCDAAHVGDTIRAHRTAMTKRGIDVSQMPLLLPITRCEDLNPLTTVFSVEHNLPFECTILPVMYEHVRDVLRREGDNLETMMLTLPYLPMPVVCGMLPHVLFQKTFPPAMNSFMWIRHLMATMKMCIDDATMHEPQTLERLLEEHDERRNIVDKGFVDATDELLREHFAIAGPTSTDVTDALLCKFEQVCCRFQLNHIRALERTVASFYEAVNQPKRRVNVRGPKDMRITDPSKLSYAATPEGGDGIPAEYMGVLWCSMVVLPLEKTRKDVRDEILQETIGVLKARDKLEWGEEAENYTWTYVRSNADLELCTQFSSFAQLRQHWQHVFSETPFDQYAWYTKGKATYEQALIEGISQAHIEGGDNEQPTTDDSQKQLVASIFDDMPAMVPASLPDLPTGQLCA